ncbi:MAG: InlB B-repeat-containing protein [Gaiellaceae bacterium]
MTTAKSVSAVFSSGGGASTAPLSVTVSGLGRVTGGGISCGNGASACGANVALNSSVTLVATPASGASFLRWGGACSGSNTRCTLTLNAAKSVSATFSGATTPAGTLTINVSGQGSVSSPAGKCTGTGPTKTCVQKLKANQTIVIKAVAASGSRFAGWSGACTGAKAACTLTLSTGKDVTAKFVPAAPAGLQRIGSPLVKRSAAGGFKVTLHFSTARAGTARLTAFRAGRAVVVLPLRVAAGPVTIGPFAVRRPGFYTFEVSLGAQSIRWHRCLGGCFAHAPGPDFVLVGETPQSARSGDAWSVTLRLRANLISEGRLRVLRGKKVLVRRSLLPPAGRFEVGPFLFGPGSYTIVFSATDAFGRVQTLTWTVALAR